MAGISVVQGLHQVAQKFTSTILPRYWLRLCDLPSKSIRLKSSACMPTVGTREPILHPSKAGNPTNATSSAITTSTVLVLLDLMSAPLLQPLRLRWVQHLERACKPKDKTGFLRQTVIGIPRHWNRR